LQNSQQFRREAGHRKIQVKIDFLIMGSQKSGTTALTYFLMQHPEIYIPSEKEIHFFDDDALFEQMRGCVDYNEYHRRFDPQPGSKVVGEATPIYMYWKPSAPRIQQYNAQMKLILILRNPIDRAYSQYILQRGLRKEQLSFSDAIRRGVPRPGQGPRQSREQSYVGRGFYARQIKHLLRYFPKSQMLFINNEDLRRDHSNTLNRVFDFLGVRRVSFIKPAIINSSSYQPMEAADRRYLASRFRRDIKELEKMLGWDCSDWLTSE